MKQLSRAFEIGLHLIFVVLFVMSIVLYKERLFADAAYYLFKAVNSGFFHVEHGRIVLGISQLLPLMATLIGLPLKFVLLIASLGHELFYYIIFLLLLYSLKDKAAAFALVGIHLVGQLWLYYSPMLEICYGAGAAILFASILIKEKKSSGWLILLILSQWFALSSHPANIILVGFVIAYRFLEVRKWNYHFTVSSVLLLIALFIELSTMSAYESSHLTISSAIADYELKVLNSSYFGGVIQVFTNYYADLLVLSAAAAALLIYRKKWFPALLFIFTLACFVILVNEIQSPNFFDRYNESVYNPLVFMVLFVFCYEIFSLRKKWLSTFGASLLLFIFVFRIFWIWDFGEPLRKRSQQLVLMINQCQLKGNSKFVVNSANLIYSDLIVNWALPVEALLFSAMDGKENTVSLITTDDLNYENNQKNLKEENFIFRRFELQDLNFLNENYFYLPTTFYEGLNTAPEAIEEVLSNRKIELSVETDPFLEAGDTTSIEIKIVNGFKHNIPSSLDYGIYLSYHWYQNDSLISWDGIRTPLEIDVSSSYSQNLRIALPKDKGVYQLVPDIVIEGKAWMNLDLSYNLAVN